MSDEFLGRGKEESSRAQNTRSNTTTGDDSSDVDTPAVNESWRLCIEHKWTALQMRLGLFPEESRAVQLQTKRSLLHEVVAAAVKEEKVGVALPADDGRRNNLQPQQQRTVSEVVSNDNVIRQEDYSSRPVEDRSRGAEAAVPVVDGRSTSLTNRAVSPWFLRSVYFSCPQAMLLQDSLKGYTPLHCALFASATSTSADRQHKQTLFGFIETLLELCQGRCVVDSEYDWLDGSENEERDDSSSTSTTSAETDEEDVNEQAVFLLRDHLGDTPLHTACRHGCNKHILQALMKACPSALCQTNHKGITPLRQLWNTLEERMSGIGAPTERNIYAPSSSGSGAKQVDVATKSLPQNEKASSTSGLSVLENILENKIKTHNDLTKFPEIQDTWEKSVVLLHLLRMWWGQSSKDDLDSAIAGYLQHDIFHNFLLRRESPDFLTSTTINPGDISSVIGENEARQSQNFSDEQFKKRKHGASLSTADGKNSSVVEIKGVEPDENGMIPMRSYKDGQDEDVDRRTFYHSSMHSYHRSDGEEVTNLFFERE